MSSAELLDDFRRALAQFKDALAMPAGNDVVKAGCIQYFEFTFESQSGTRNPVANDL